ncbi:hypothetical protein [uncultured Clostridium sp.]|uniref:hypothetical protein n=1 Tax=uncultured Clostridium sp. TaxID=59620 RepID=UPI00261CA2FB|nr:hypothetical protein [uncultured Clostridium sp.]
MRGLTTIAELLNELEGQNIKIQKVMFEQEKIVKENLGKQCAIVFLLITSVQAKRDNKHLEIYKENNYEYTIRISDFWGKDITEYRISRCRQVAVC